MPFVPQVDRHGALFIVDAAHDEDAVQLLSGPALVPPSAPGVDPWEPGPGEEGVPVTEWSDATGHVGYGVLIQPNESWRVDVPLPDGYYSRISKDRRIR
jgi:hypothetical protein